MSKKDFNLMTYGEFYRWWDNISSKYLNEWEVEYREPFSIGKGDVKKWSIPYKTWLNQMLWTDLERILNSFINHSVYPDIITMLKQNDGNTIFWNYESICDFLNEPKYLLLPEGELKYFWERKASEFPTHLNRILSEIRYMKVNYASTEERIVKSKEFGNSNYYEDGSFSTTEEAKSVLQEYLRKEWNDAEWTSCNYLLSPYDFICFDKRVLSSYDNPPSNVIRYARANMIVIRLRIKIANHFRGKYHLYLVPDKFAWASDDTDYFEHRTGEMFQNLPDVPNWGQWYHVINQNVDASSGKEDVKTFFYGYDKTPPTDITFAKNKIGGSVEYTTGFGVSNNIEIYDIQPDKPTTFLP